MKTSVKDDLGTLPRGSGVYLFRDERGDVLYVGKAKSLRSRVRSYFQRGDGRPGAAQLVDRIAEVEVIVTRNEAEALHLEQNLVKRHRPPFNIRLRDDKSFPYIAVTLTDDYPRVMFTRERHRPGTVYFGPYANAKKVRQTLDVLNRVFKFRPCEGPRPGRQSGIPCLDFHIDRCFAPCIGAISKDEYGEIVDGVIGFLSGDTLSIQRELEGRMREAAADERFEEAARYRNRLNSIRHLSERQAATAARTKDARALYEVVTREAGARVRFDERYYLHPTDQGFSEMETSRMGRCEDITNMTTYLARSVGLATAADFTPAWGHRDNNHAWNVLLDAQGRGSDPVGARAAKVYRKTFSIQRDGLVDRLPKGREAPNRWLASRALVDVTDQYGPTTDVELFVDARRGEERIGYLCVFNGGDWTAIAWSSVEWGPPSRPLAEPIASSKGATRVRFSAMGRRLLYLPAVHDGTSLRAVGSPFVVHMDGSIATLDGDEGSQTCLATATSPEQQSPDTKEVTPTSNLVPGTTYVLHRFVDGRWAVVEERVAPREPLRFEKMSPSSLYWLVAKDSRRLERPFTVEGGRQRFW